MKLTGPHNNSHPGKLNAAARVEWSCRRTWHGEKVKVYLHAELTKADAAAVVKVHPKGTSTDLDTISGTTLTAYASGCEYDVKLKDKPYAKHVEFELKATVDEKVEPARSAPLYVDLDTP